MKLYTNAVTYLSPLLVLGATTSASTCLTKNDCAEGEYCADIVQQCLPIGGCVEELDCNNPDNQPYAVAMCMGTLDCEEGMCVMNCGGDDSSSPSSLSSFCAADTDCLEGQYCAQGECLTNGMCKSDADCFNPNHLFADVMCIGYQYCDRNDGYCKRQCGEQCPFGKEAEECSITGCDTRIRIPGAVSCAPDFCDDCKGIHFDAAGFVITGWENTGDGDQSPESTASSDDVESSKSESLLPTAVNCESEDDCSDNEYCASEGVCLTIGNCNENSDCLDDDNQPFAVALCMGTLECQEGVCAMNCGTDGTTAEEINNINTADLCSSNDDCDQGEYCAKGTCLSNGMCKSDSDCKNPDHIFADVMCIGYQYCDGTDGYCKRQCGEQCPPGKVVAECSVTGCDTRIRIPGAISCAPDYCDDCKGIHYDAAGNVITGWENTSDGNNNKNQSSDEISNDSMDSSVDAVPLEAVAAAAPRGNLCTSKNDCSDNQYCSVESGVCLRIGDCESNADCFDNNNQPFAVALCMGTLECQHGICAMDCGAHDSDDDEKADNGNNRDDNDSHDHASHDHDHDSSDDIDLDANNATNIEEINSNSAGNPISLELEPETVTFEAAVSSSAAGTISITLAAIAASSLLLESIVALA